MRFGRTTDATTYGQRFAAAALALLAMLLFLAPGAVADSGSSGHGGHGKHGAFVPPKLDDDSFASPAQVFRVIVQGNPSTGGLQVFEGDDVAQRSGVEKKMRRGCT